jgi:hypothetical protein
LGGFGGRWDVGKGGDWGLGGFGGFWPVGEGGVAGVLRGVWGVLV